MACCLGLFLCTYNGKDVLAATAENSCGKSATWTYNASKKTLTISGKGMIYRPEDWDELEINKIVVGKGITEIGSYTFYNQNNVTEINLPETVTIIGDFAFANCYKLKKINIPKSLTSIGNSVFSDCKKLKSVSLPDTVTQMGDSIFSGCKVLESVKLPKNIKEIPSWTFRGCKNLTKFKISSNIEKIGYEAFSRTGLTKVTVPDTVKEMEGNIFSYCPDLVSATWNYKTVTYRAFAGCGNLTKIVLGAKVSEINSDAFSGVGFKTYRIPETVTKVGSYAFSSCPNLEKLTISKNVKAVPSYIVSRCENIKKVVIEDGVKSIADYAFANSSITSISMPSSITKVGYAAFFHAEKLVYARISDSVKKIEDKTFANCYELSKLKIGKSVNQIGETAFIRCYKLDKVVIPGSVKKIGYRAFTESGVKSLYISDGVSEIDYWAFCKCPELTSVYIGKDVSKIRYSAFLQCDKLTKLVVSKENKVYASKDNVLYSANMTRLINCSVTKEGTFTIPATVSKIYGSSFSKCTKITNFAVEPGNKYFTTENGILYNTDKTVLVSCPSGKKGTIKVPSTVKEIADYAFHYSMASYVKLPNGLQKIGYCVFEYCDKLKQIVIPGTVKSIGCSAFWNCTALKEVEIMNGVTKLPDDVFAGCSRLEKITVPVSVNSISSTAFRNCNYSIVFYTKKSSYAMKYATKSYYRYKLI